MSLSRKVAFNTAIQILAKTVTVGLTVLTTILLTRHLGPAGYGDYTYVLTLAIIFGALADWGTATIGVREVVKDKKNQALWLGNILLVRLLLAFVASLLLLLLVFFLPLKSGQPELLRQSIRLGSLVVIFVAIKASFTVAFQAHLQMQKAVIAEIVTSALILLLSWSVIRLQGGFFNLVLVVVVATAVASLVAALLALRSFAYLFRPNRKIIKRLVNESLPMGAVLLMFTMDNKIDTVMLGTLKGSNAVGVYGLAYHAYDVLILGAAYLMNTMLPVISGYADLARWLPKLKRIYQQVFDLLLIMGVTGVVLIWLLAPAIIHFLTQERFAEFAGSVPVLRLLSLAMLVAYFNHLTGYTIVALGKQRPYFLVALSSLIFNVLVNLLVIPRFSYLGAAWVTILTEALVLLATTLMISRWLKIIPSFFHFPQTIRQVVHKRGKIF